MDSFCALAQRGFCTLDSHESGGLIPPELLRDKTVLKPDCATGIFLFFILCVWVWGGGANCQLI